VVRDKGLVGHEVLHDRGSATLSVLFARKPPCHKQTGAPTAMRRARSIDLENPFSPTIEGICELLLVRHGEQELPLNLAVGDALDAPLSEQGQRQAAAVGARLADHEIHAVYSSPLQRALRTGEAIATPHGLVPVTVDALREFDPWESFPSDKGFYD